MALRPATGALARGAALAIVVVSAHACVLTDGSAFDAYSPAPACVAPAGLGPCDTFPQCGCAAGQNCVSLGGQTGETTCITATGSSPSYGACTGPADCAIGYACVGGLCKEFCNNGTDCPLGGICVAVSEGDKPPIPGLLVCSRPCAPWNPESSAGGRAPCGPGVACVAADPTKGYGEADCVASQGKAESAACVEPSLAHPFYDCGPGLLCADHVCHRYCRQSVPADCAGVCLGFNPPAKVGADMVGICYPGPCDLLDPKDGAKGFTACPPASMCSWFISPVSAAVCVGPAGPGGDAAACASDGDCMPGLGCNPVPDASAPSCRAWCRLSAQTCPGAEMCCPPVHPILQQGEALGICAPGPTCPPIPD